MSSNSIHVFVYGSLMRGLHNHHCLTGARFLDTAETLDRFVMYNLGYYPGVMPTGRKDAATVKGELYTVSQDTLDRLDSLEDHPDHYIRTSTKLASGRTAWMYIYRGQRPLETAIVPNGDWREFKKKSQTTLDN